MDLHQLKTFVVVAREGSITRASERLYLSQPAVSAHIKALEASLELSLFERTPRGMSLTVDGQRLLAKAEQTLQAHQELLEEATRIKGRLTGKLRLGITGRASTQALGGLLTHLSERFPEMELALQHGSSAETLDGIRSGHLDAGFYNEAGEPHAELTVIEVAHFAIHLAAPPGMIASPQALDWKALAEVPWIFPTASTCCGRAAEKLFEKHQIRPGRVIHIDREPLTRTLIASRVGVGLLHVEKALDAQTSGDIELLGEIQQVRVLFAHLTSRTHDPLVSAASAIVRTAQDAPAAG